MRLRLALMILVGVAGCSAAPAAPPPAEPSTGAASATMRAFANDREFDRFARRVAARQEARRRTIPAPPPIVSAPAPPPAEMAVAPASNAQDVVVTGARVANPGITNTQEADVDEGGIVKVVGDHLVVLRRGRLFSVSTAGGAMRPIDHIDAFPPGTSGAGAWYDEMLVSGDRIVVVGYSYARGGTEINRFRIGPDGRLRYEDSYHLRSNDYYSSSNYASRLIGSTLIFYTPLEFDAARPFGALPGLRRWTGRQDVPFERTLSVTQLYVPAPVRRSLEGDVSTLHTVTRCDLVAPRLSCRATAVLGSSSRTFYVSGDAVYVWTGDEDAARTGAFVYRMPLDGSAPGAVRAWGGPIDQFSFREDRDTHRLNVVVRAESRGDAMWGSEVSDGAAALLTLPVAAFGDGSRRAPHRAYRALPLNADADSWSFHNRFVGRHLIYTAGEFNEQTRSKEVFAVSLDGGAVARIAVPHGVDRIDVIGSDAIAIGSDTRERLGFSAIELDARSARLGDTYLLPAAREGERRSQAFFFRPDDDSRDGASGMLGLPVTRDLGETSVARFLGSGSAVAFLRRDSRRFSPAGELVANAATARDDACQASCVDWYGNARPIFLGRRVFALMGYELVEGRVAGGLIGERARVDFAPGGKR